uniref:Uncharacterized protein n=1 Tax=Oryza rufipogon TaxID=4529 RepID=A0A0E0PWI2_ORYRU
MEMAAGMEVAARLTTAGGSGGEAGDGGRIRRCRPFWPPGGRIWRAAGRFAPSPRMATMSGRLHWRWRRSNSSA